MTKIKVGDDRYKAMLKEYFEEQGPNPAVGMIARWGWHVVKEREFKAKLLREGNLEIDGGNK